MQFRQEDEENKERIKSRIKRKQEARMKKGVKMRSLINARGERWKKKSPGRNVY